MSRFPLTVLVSLLLLSTACTSGFTGSGQPASDQIEEIKARVLELQRQAAVTQVELDRLRQEVAMLRALGGSQPGGADPAPPEPAERVTPGPIDARPEKPAAAIESAELEPRSVPASAAGELPTSTTPPPSAVDLPSAGSTAPSPPSSRSLEPLSPEAQRLYDRGYTFYHQGNYVDAEAAFQLFMKENPRAELSDNASYWIGESRYARGDTAGALAAFRETLERYPEGNKVPDALLKIADCLAAMGDREGARIAYGEVISRFPNSAAAVMAQERRQRLE
jgi:tol-pal system protein YbgF